MAIFRTANRKESIVGKQKSINMGAGCSNMSGDDKRAAEQSRAIDKELAQAKKKATKEVKLLLLGAGASGKSTVAKQMHILYLNGFGESELIEYKQQVATNMVNNMRALLLGARKLGNGPPSTCFYILFLLISFHLRTS